MQRTKGDSTELCRSWIETRFVRGMKKVGHKMKTGRGKRQRQIQKNHESTDEALNHLCKSGKECVPLNFLIASLLKKISLPGDIIHNIHIFIHQCTL